MRRFEKVNELRNNRITVIKKSTKGQVNIKKFLYHNTKDNEEEGEGQNRVNHIEQYI